MIICWAKIARVYPQLFRWPISSIQYSSVLLRFTYLTNKIFFGTVGFIIWNEKSCETFAASHLQQTGFYLVRSIVIDYRTIKVKVSAVITVLMFIEPSTVLSEPTKFKTVIRRVYFAAKSVTVWKPGLFKTFGAIFPENISCECCFRKWSRDVSARITREDLIVGRVSLARTVL